MTAQWLPEPDLPRAATDETAAARPRKNHQVGSSLLGKAVVLHHLRGPVHDISSTRELSGDNPGTVARHLAHAKQCPTRSQAYRSGTQTGRSSGHEYPIQNE